MQSDFYHAALVLKNKSEERIENLTKDEFISKIINPYKRGTEIFINGKGINPFHIERIHLRKTKQHTDIITKRLEREEEINNRNSGIISFGGPYPFELAIYEGENIIDDFISGSPGYEINKREVKSNKANEVSDILVAIDKKRVDWIEKIAIAKTDEVITELRSFAISTGNNDLIEELVNQSQRWHRLQKKIRDNVLETDKEDIECNKINKALLHIINTLKTRLTT